MEQGAPSRSSIDSTGISEGGSKARPERSSSRQVPHGAESPVSIPYPLVFAQANDGLLVFNPSRRVCDVNPAMESLAELRREELIGRSCFEVLRGKAEAPLDTTATEQGWELESIIAKARPFSNWPATIVLKDGRRREVGVSYSPLTIGSDSGLYGLLAVRPASPEKNRERLPADLISTVSHELRTPLTSVKGCASMLLHHRDGLDEERVRDFLRIIDEQADRLRELIDNLADLSKIESGALRIKRRPVPLGVLLEKVVEVCESHGLHVDTSLRPNDLPALDVDPRRVEQLLRGLVETLAVGSRTGADARIECQSRENEVLFSIAGGRDIRSEAQATIDENSSSGQHHLGIQLSICRGIVSAHGGRMWIENSPTLGSTVHLTLPVAAQRTLPTPPMAGVRVNADVKRAAAEQPRVSGGRQRVLVADDDMRIVKFVRASLEAEGFEVRVASDGPSALDSLVLEQPDLILLDLVFPDMDGFEVCRRIREFSTVPIIVLTAKDAGADKVRALDLGADDYLTKPFDTAELIARLRAVMRRASFGGDPEVRPVFESGNLRIDFARRRVTVGENEVSLTPTEYKVLHQLVTNAGRVLVHEELLSRVWGPEYRGETEYLRSYIRHLRRKIEEDTANPQHILTQPGVGYYFRAPE